MPRNLLVQPVEGGDPSSLVVAVVEQAQQQGRKGSQHLDKQRRGNCVGQFQLVIGHIPGLSGGATGRRSILTPQMITSHESAAPASQ